MIFLKNGRAEQDGHTANILFIENNMDLQHHQGIPVRLPAINWEERLSIKLIQPTSRGVGRLHC